MAWSSTPSQHVAHDDQRPSPRTLAEARQRRRDARRGCLRIVAQDRVGPPVLEVKIERRVADLSEDRGPLRLHRTIIKTAVRDEFDVATGVLQEESGRLDCSRRFAAQRRR